LFKVFKPLKLLPAGRQVLNLLNLLNSLNSADRQILNSLNPADRQELNSLNLLNSLNPADRQVLNSLKKRRPALFRTGLFFYVDVSY
jgi:hypothetical protein